MFFYVGSNLGTSGHEDDWLEVSCAKCDSNSLCLYAPKTADLNRKMKRYTSFISVTLFDSLYNVVFSLFKTNLSL